MRFTIILAGLAIVLGTSFPGCGTSTYVSSAGSDYSSYNIDELDSYGEWLDIPAYGRVWRPSVVSGWQPYFNGHWSYNGTEWIWVSYEPFGWIVYHYGDWNYVDPYGWVWIPGDDQWSPARVQWIEYGDYIGWCPLPYGTARWPEPWEHGNVHPWNIVRREDFNSENIGARRINDPPPADLRNEKRPERRPPDVNIVQRYVKAPIPVVKFEREPVLLKQQPARIENAPAKTPPPPSVPERTIHRMRLPDQEQARVEHYRPTIEKEVLIPRPPKKPGSQERKKKD